MRLKLKEDPKEWQKFTLVVLVLCTGFNILLWRRGVFLTLLFQGVFVLLAGVATWCLLRPAHFRNLYRGGMTVSHAIGQVMGKVMLTLFFFLALTPLGLFLKALGKDPLDIRTKGNRSTYWIKHEKKSSLERMF